MKLDFTKPLKDVIGNDHIEYARTLRHESKRNVLCIVTFVDSTQYVLWLDKEGKDVHDNQRVVNAPIEHTKTYWLAHWKDGGTTLLLLEPCMCKEGNPDCLSITGPHTDTFVEGQGL
jgi:hypothetical protein